MAGWVLLALHLIPASNVYSQAPPTALPPTNRIGLPGLQPDSTTLLPNGWSLKAQGTHVQMGDFPAMMRLSPDDRHLSVHETVKPSNVLVIAHRGASGYLPEHSEGAKVLAIAQGADVVEQDVVLTRDGVLVVSHDITMDATTNVRDVYPNRARKDGHYYYADFDWSELREVALRERSLNSARGSSRFPYATGSSIMRLEDEIALVRGLNQTLGKKVGFHIELKAPGWHLKEFGSHMADKLIAVLKEHKFNGSSDLCFIQCFEAGELQYLHDTLKCELPLVQLLGGRPLGLLAGGEAGTDRLATLKLELKEIAKYADGIGPAIPMLFTSEDGHVESNGFVEAAHAEGLVVHPYTVRKDALPEWCDDVDDLHRMLINELKVDGFFTDFPDLARAAIDSQ